MEYEKIKAALNELQFTWLTDEINEFISMGKIEEIYEDDATQKKVLGLRSIEYTPEEKNQIVIEWIYAIFIELPGVMLKGMNILQMDKKNAAISLEGVKFENKYNDKGNKALKDLLNNILRNTSDQDWLTKIKTDSWVNSI